MAHLVSFELLASETQQAVLGQVLRGTRPAPQAGIHRAAGRHLAESEDTVQPSAHYPDASVTIGPASASLASRRMLLARARRWFRASWLDISWVAFVALNLAAMRLLPAWQTIPFLAIWVSLNAIYGIRLWRLQPTLLTVAAVVVATSGIIGVQVVKGQQDADYLAEVPLIALMFLIMVWHGRRRLAAMQDRLTAMETAQRASHENVRLLQQQRRFLQDASHELGTPITVALGHAELIERAVSDPVIARDARVVANELGRLRELAGRLLLLASVDSPGFLHLAPVTMEAVIVDALDRWGHPPRSWRVGPVVAATVTGDEGRLAAALDALLDNAIAHTGPGGSVEVSARIEGSHVVLAVTDTGCGIPPGDLERVFDRFARLGNNGRTRADGGFGLGLAIVRAIAEAHSGSVRVRSTLGQGSVFELLLPLAAASGTVSASDRLAETPLASSEAAVQ
jgi:signal transduction histidine kinase